MIGIELVRKCDRYSVPDRFKSLINKEVLCGYSNNKIVIVDKLPLKYRLPFRGIQENKSGYAIIEVYRINEEKQLKIYYGKLVDIIPDDLKHKFKYSDNIEIDEKGYVRIYTITGYVISLNSYTYGISFFEFPDEVLSAKILNRLGSVVTIEFTSKVREGFIETKVFSLYDLETNFAISVTDDKKALKSKIIEWQLELINELEEELSKHIKKYNRQINSFEEIMELDITQKLFKLYGNVFNILSIDDKVKKVKRILIRTILENELD